MPKHYLIGWLLVLWTLTVPAQAQLTHALRLELPTHPTDDETFDVTPSPTGGCWSPTAGTIIRPTPR